MPISPQEAGLTRRTMIAAGLRSNRAVAVFYGLKIILALVFLVGAGFVWANISNPILKLLVWPAFSCQIWVSICW